MTKIKDKHNCNQNIESNMCPTHCIICGKDMGNKIEDKIIKDALKRLRNSGWYPHLKNLGRRGLAEFEGAYLMGIEQALKQAKQERDKELVEIIKTFEDSDIVESSGVWINKKALLAKLKEEDGEDKR